MSVEELAISHYKSQGFLNGNYIFMLCLINIESIIYNVKYFYL